MKDPEELKKIINNKNTYTIDELRDLYGIFNIDIRKEIIIAKKDNLTHLYTGNKNTKKIKICIDLLPYDKKLHEIKSNEDYPESLCNIILYDRYINRYAHGILIPCKSKFVMIDDFNLNIKPNVSSFYTCCTKDNHKTSRKLTDTVGNVYTIDNYDNDFSFNTMTNPDSKSPKSKYGGFVISYKGNPVYAETRYPSHIILNKESFLNYCYNFIIEQRGRNFLQNVNIDQFDDGFMLGHGYTKKL